MIASQMSLANFLIGRRIKMTVTPLLAGGATARIFPRNNNRVYIGFFVSDVLCEWFIACETQTGSALNLIDEVGVVQTFEFSLVTHGDLPTKRWAVDISNGAFDYAVIEGYLPDEVLTMDPRRLLRESMVY